MKDLLLMCVLYTKTVRVYDTGMKQQEGWSIVLDHLLILLDKAPWNKTIIWNEPFQDATAFQVSGSTLKWLRIYCIAGSGNAMLPQLSFIDVWSCFHTLYQFWSSCSFKTLFVSVHPPGHLSAILHDLAAGQCIHNCDSFSRLVSHISHREIVQFYCIQA